MADESAVARFQNQEGMVPGVSDAISPDSLIRQVALIQQVMKSVMREGEHYGVIPGTDKPTLYKAGAEKLLLTFRFAPSYEVKNLEIVDPPPGAVMGHREVQIKCTITHIPSGSIMGEGVGLASTLESKWRYRSGPVTFTDKPVPKEYWDNRKTDPAKAQAVIGGKGFVARKNETGVWVIAQQGEKVENENPADQFNTVLKMAKIRALRDAVLSCTAASDIFTQDLETVAGVEGMDDPAVTGSAAHGGTSGASSGHESSGEAKAVSEGMVRLMHVLFGKIKVEGEEAKHKFAGSFLNKTVEHLSKLSMDDGRKLIDHLTEAAKKAS